ncbi:uncharacterized protein TrAtP1_008103 [Trichoderma atroviride]|uniref:RBR-type E3 ubiquitin transferase n=1 Tax=Hypocrea atroviridis (strain ATCC 20476 / IMI 206040) TaxID=452589 RepID=G9NYM9_HYPAI|nr:uncharacterized protein TRIATDRAFT_35778 [Trichoderma atroviride IMI 206040]EHK43703.1 hypothetical protein TRIATDRAFT_35778 [Trichoderma atroviride IMI 206040]UKZ66938.1 hypothetical protein TrAtP1_008103 [Trichoderma atroviride]
MKVECIICGDYKGTMSFPQSPITKECTHFPTACLRCLRKMLRSELERKQWEDIKCPECGAVLQYQEIQKFADDDTKKKLDTLIIQRATQDDPNFLWCSSDCGFGQLHEGGSDEPIMRCNSCSNLTCFQHKKPWHKGLTCEQFDEQEAASARHKKEDAASTETIKQVTKPCPNCKVHIQKNGGW